MIAFVFGAASFNEADTGEWPALPPTSPNAERIKARIERELPPEQAAHWRHVVDQRTTEDLAPLPHVSRVPYGPDEDTKREWQQLLARMEEQHRMGKIAAEVLAAVKQKAKKVLGPSDAV